MSHAFVFHPFNLRVTIYVVQDHNFYSWQQSHGHGHIFVALHRWVAPLFLLDTMISPVEFEDPPCDASSDKRTQKKRKRDSGKGGVAAHYCTMSIACRIPPFLAEPFEERLDSLNQ